ncbi:MAG TPA: PH domain-containing protein, partial [Thermoplasmata archaeon]|nr:PH domain-containing protein [Thermoplasmata archaeon]
TGAALLVLAVLGLLTVAALAWLATRWGEWLSDVYVVTSDRLIEQTGLVRHEIREIPLDQVRNIDVDQVSLVARAFGYGSLRINSLQTGRSGGQAVPLVHTMNPRNIAADAAGVEFWVGVPDPLKIQRRIEWAHEGLNPQPRRRAAQAA